jgi:hypothetical protein
MTSAQPAAASVSERQRRFQLILIKPSHYDDEGYVIQWAFSWLMSNTLAVLRGIATDARDRQVLGPDVAIDTTSIDETISRVRTRDIIRQVECHSGFALVCLVGVQANEFPRAVDIARPLRAAGIPVVIGGFHVSGCLSMLPALPKDLQEALDLGVSLFAGEAEGRFDAILLDAAAGALKPIYNFVNDYVPLESAPKPVATKRHIARLNVPCVDAGRGCPYQCSFCTIINVHGRKSRSRSADEIAGILRDYWKLGRRKLFITDDNFARNPHWESILDQIIALRERENIRFNLYLQVDVLCHKIPRFIEKSARAGVRWAFLGLENINPENLRVAKKPQNKITEYRKMLHAWRAAGIITTGGYILGFPADTLASIKTDIDIIKRELPIDFLQFYFLTPFPGSEDHRAMMKAGTRMDPDMNKYEAEHAVVDHPLMSREEWAASYLEAWKRFYDRTHCLTILRRARASGLSLPLVMEDLIGQSSMVAIENLHPIQAGVLRRRYRGDRRAGYESEPAWRLYPRYAAETAVKIGRLLGRALYLWSLVAYVYLEPGGRRYTDQALTPVSEGETDSLMLFTQTPAARAAVSHARKIAALTSAGVSKA